MDHPSSGAVGPVMAPPPVPVVPLVLASVAASVVTVVMLFRLLIEAALLWSSDAFLLSGVDTVNPTLAEVIGVTLQTLALPTLVIIAAAVTWHAAFRRLTVRCRWAAITTVVLALAAFVI